MARTTSKAGALGAPQTAGAGSGVVLIPAATPLTRLNYFDGKFLRADDLQAEQRYLRRLVEHANRAGGAGVVEGFDLDLAGGDRLVVRAGLAIDPRGRTLLLPADQSIAIGALVERMGEAVQRQGVQAAVGAGRFGPCTLAQTPPATAQAERSWMLVTIAHAEAACGQEDVQGALCEAACTTGTAAPWWLEGVVVRLEPLALATPLPASTSVALTAKHLRSRLASAFFADEARTPASRISAAGLASETWCHGAPGLGGESLAIGVLVREGGRTVFLDAWTARRERIATPPLRWWQGSMGMRPTDVWLAQVLQFQCQLRDLLAGAGGATGGGDDDDPCRIAKGLVGEAALQFDLLRGLVKDTSTRLAELRPEGFALAADVRRKLDDLGRLGDRLVAAQAVFGGARTARALVEGGIVELPAAGWLPVVPGELMSVDEQVRRWMGDGVDLRLCIVAPDVPPHAWEEAQHMARISLLEGLDDATRKPRVDVLVPDGRFAPGRDEQGRAYEMRLNLLPDNLRLLAAAIGRAQRVAGVKAVMANRMAGNLASLSTGLAAREGETYEFRGAARGERTRGGGFAFHYAGLSDSFALEKPADAQAAAEAAVAPAAAVAAAAPSVATAQPMLAVRSNLDTDTRAALLGEAMVANRIDPRAWYVAEVDGLRGLRASLWTSLSIDDDPAALARGAATAVRGEALLLVVSPKAVKAGAAAGTAAVLLRAGFSGALRIEAVESRDGGRTASVRGELAGDLSVTVTTSTDEEPIHHTLHLAEALRIERSDGPHGARFELAFDDPRIGAPLLDALLARRAWTGATTAEAVAQMRVRGSTEGDALGNATTRQFFRAWQTLQPAVAEASHPAHERAVRALRSIGSMLASPRFADVKAALLFPAPAAGTPARSVLATRDWVLFHRRRDHVCDAPPQDIRAPERHYAVHQVAVDDAAGLKRLAKALAGNDTAALGKFAFDYLQVVDYAPAVPSVLTPAAQVRATWRQDVGAAAGPIVAGFVASRGAAVADGKPLAQERLAALADLLDVEFEVRQPVTAKVLDRVPDALAEGTTDGVMVLVTMKPAVAANTHEVWAVEADLMDRIPAAVKGGELAGTLAQSNGVLLATLNFTEASAPAAALAAMAARWPDGAADPAGGFLVHAQGDAAAARYAAQWKVAQAAFGGTGNATLLTSQGPLSGAPAVSVFPVVAQTRRALLVYALRNADGSLRPNSDIPVERQVFRMDVPIDPTLQFFVRNLAQKQLPVGLLHLAWQLPQPGETAANKRRDVAVNFLINELMPSPGDAKLRALTAAEIKALEPVAAPDSYDEVLFFARG